jgi:hypothetical protein
MWCSPEFFLFCFAGPPMFSLHIHTESRNCLEYLITLCLVGLILILHVGNQNSGRPLAWSSLVVAVFRRHRHHHHHNHHHLALQHFMGFRLLSQVSPSSSIFSYFLPVFTFSFLKSVITFSCYCCLGLPTVLVPIDLQSNNFLVCLAWSVLWICPSHLILYALMYLTINFSISMLFRVLHIL